MSEIDDVELETEIEPTEEVENTEVVETEPAKEEVEDTDKLKELNKKLYERAKKAEAEVKELKSKPEPKEPEPKKEEGLTPLDTIALINAKVTNEEDITEVLSFAKYRNIPVAEALKSNVVKTILAQKAEERRTSEATNTQGARRGVSKPTDDTILEQASQGKLPEDPELLAQARMNKMKSK